VIADTGNAGRESTDVVIFSSLLLVIRLHRLEQSRSLPYRISAEEMYDIFGKYGALRQIRLGDPSNHGTRGTAYIVYEDIFDAKNACEHLNGFQVAGRYIVVRSCRAWIQYRRFLVASLVADAS
jgi:pre-mRNA branch site protein p14